MEERESHKENKKPMSISSVADAIESVVKANLPQKSDFDNNANNRSLDVNPSIRNGKCSANFSMLFMQFV